ncbi:MAG TPA: hypothetical protein EYG68_05730 [Leucothrix mucor]|nr:hypothetical protein [Leucothrix mucor]
MDNKTMTSKSSEFDLVFERVCKRIKAVLKSSNIDLMTKCEIYHIARSVKDTRDRQVKLSESLLVNQQFTEALYRAEKSVNIIINNNKADIH